MTLDPRRASLREACRSLTPVYPDYATLPIEEGFDWSPLADATFERLYLVVFRSVRRETADLDLLRRYDDRAYAEALRRGGLLRYFKGEMNERRECLSFCLWESWEQAVNAAGASSHSEAARITAQMYESYRLYRYDLLKPAAGELLFRPLGEQAQEFGASSGPETYAKRG